MPENRCYHGCELHVPSLQGLINIQCRWYGHDCSSEAVKTLSWLAACQIAASIMPLMDTDMSTHG
jgi:hypothetical protein